MHSPQWLHRVRSSTIGTRPVTGCISVPSEMQSLVHEAMQRPQPLQYSGTRKGRGFWTMVVTASPPEQRASVTPVLNCADVVS